MYGPRFIMLLFINMLLVHSNNIHAAGMLYAIGSTILSPLWGMVASPFGVMAGTAVYAYRHTTEENIQARANAASRVVARSAGTLTGALNDELKKNAIALLAMTDQKDFKEAVDRSAESLANRFADFADGMGNRLKARGHSLSDTSNKFLQSIFNGRNTLRVVVPIVCTASVPYATRLVWNKIEALLAYKPAVVLPGSNISVFDKFNRWRSGYKTPEMIMSDDQKERLEEIIEKAKVRETRGNLLLTGEPGTGKSLFAQYLADKAGLDFMATTAGALFQQDKAIQHIDEIFSRAKKSKNGCVFFIDEADALFVDRNRLDVGSLHYKALNHLLARTGQGNEKFMIVAATNHAQVMDEAMARRFQDHIEMVLPDEKTRKRLVQLYAKTHLFNVKNNGKKFVLEAQKVFTPEIIDQIVRDTHNLSHAEINDIIEAMRNKALSAKVAVAKGTRKKPERLLKVEHITSAVAQGVKKHQFFDIERKKSPLPAA